MHNVCLRADTIKKRFLQHKGFIDVLNGISYEFKSGHTYAIIGASGAGKSTFLQVLAGLTEPTEGALFVNERNLCLFSQAEREQFLNRTVGLLFQMPYLIKELTVLENVMTKGLIAGVDAVASKQEALELLEKVGLSDKAYEHPPVLSGGQQQRVALARALFGKPAFLLADEPTGNLDSKNGQIIVDFLLACKDAWGMGLIVSTHDAAIASRMKVKLEMQDGLLI